MTSAIAANGKSLAQQITDEACALIVKQIPGMIDRITDGTLAQLREKIDSEQFSEKFVNVLQSKLLADTNKSNANDETEPFLNKFIKLFDKIIDTAIYNDNQPINIKPKDIADGIEKYLIKVKDTDANAGITDTLIGRYKLAAESALVKWDAPEYKNKPTLDFIDDLRVAVKKSESIGDVLFNFALHETIEKHKNKTPTTDVPVPEAAASVVDAQSKTPETATKSNDASLVNATTDTTAKSKDDTSDNSTPAKNAISLEEYNKLGGRNKRTRKVSRKSISRKNRRNRANVLTKRNLFL